jgi:hypothetical protein
MINKTCQSFQSLKTVKICSLNQPRFPESEDKCVYEEVVKVLRKGKNITNLILRGNYLRTNTMWRDICKSHALKNLSFTNPLGFTDFLNSKALNQAFERLQQFSFAFGHEICYMAVNVEVLKRGLEQAKALKRLAINLIDGCKFTLLSELLNVTTKNLEQITIYFEMIWVSTQYCQETRSQITTINDPKCLLEALEKFESAKLEFHFQLDDCLNIPENFFEELEEFPKICANLKVVKAAARQVKHHNSGLMSGDSAPKEVSLSSFCDFLENINCGCYLNFANTKLAFQDIESLWFLTDVISFTAQIPSTMIANGFLKSVTECIDEWRRLEQLDLMLESCLKESFQNLLTGLSNAKTHNKLRRLNKVSVTALSLLGDFDTATLTSCGKMVNAMKNCKTVELETDRANITCKIYQFFDLLRQAPLLTKLRLQLNPMHFKIDLPFVKSLSHLLKAAVKLSTLDLEIKEMRYQSMDQKMGALLAKSLKTVAARLQLCKIEFTDQNGRQTTQQLLNALEKCPQKLVNNYYGCQQSDFYYNYYHPIRVRFSIEM